MRIIYQIRIQPITDQKVFRKISKYLTVKPSNLFTDIWVYKFEEQNKYFDFAQNFTDILKHNFKKPESLNIHKENISFRILYEYENQCNMELNPQSLKILGENEISLCISCWNI